MKLISPTLNTKYYLVFNILHYLPSKHSKRMHKHNQLWAIGGSQTHAYVFDVSNTFRRR